jgi:hypothetical protein
MTDAIEVLVSNGSPVAAAPNLRSSFEALLSIEYITESPTDYRKRSLSWLVAYVRNRVATYRSLVQSSDEGKEFLRAIEEDKTVRDFPLPPQHEVEAAIANLEHLLARDQVAFIQEEFANFRRRPRWHQLFGGPPNTRELARHVHRTAQYDVLYRQWSNTSHALDFSPFISRTQDGERAIRGLRDVASTNNVTTMACTFLIDATRILIDTFHPGETWGNWYIKEVRDRYLRAAGASGKPSGAA